MSNKAKQLSTKTATLIVITPTLLVLLLALMFYGYSKTQNPKGINWLSTWQQDTAQGKKSQNPPTNAGTAVSKDGSKTAWMLDESETCWVAIVPSDQTQPLPDITQNPEYCK